MIGMEAGNPSAMLWYFHMGLKSPIDCCQAMQVKQRGKRDRCQIRGQRMWFHDGGTRFYSQRMKRARRRNAFCKMVGTWEKEQIKKGRARASLVGL